MGGRGMVRSSGLDYTVLKAGMICGRGDHLVDHLSHTVQTVPLSASMEPREKTVSPIPVGERVDVLVGALEGRLSRRTAVVRGGDALLLSEAVRRVARVVDRPVRVFPAPVWAHRVLGQANELTLRVPLVAKAQVRDACRGCHRGDAAGR